MWKTAIFEIMKTKKWPELAIHQVLVKGIAPLRKRISAHLELLAEKGELRPVVHFQNGRRKHELAYNCLIWGQMGGYNLHEAKLAAEIFTKIGFLKIWLEDHAGEDCIVFELHLNGETWEVEKPQSEV